VNDPYVFEYKAFLIKAMQPQKDTVKKNILFLCTGNSCRSQMAEGWAKKLLPESIGAFSAGTSPGRIDPLAVKVMKEAGVDISGGRAKHLNELADIDFNLVITLCSGAKERCPFFPGPVATIHHGFDDPPGFAADAESEEAPLNIYRRVRDEIRDFVRNLPEMLNERGI